jgi:hypothetical protein
MWTVSMQVGQIIPSSFICPPTPATSHTQVVGGHLLMKIRLTIILTIFLISCDKNHTGTNDLADKKILKLIEDFSSFDWETVNKAKDSLELLEHESLPYLFDLLNRDNKFIKLTNTADLIYPGATEFYGHGGIIDYDIDWLTIRAGWAIEEITFQNFGFKENKITEGDLFELEMDSSKYKEYLRTGNYDFKINPEKIEMINELKKRATIWWNEKHKSWTRLKAIKESIDSKDTVRQMTALSHLRFGNCIKGLDLKTYKSLIEPTVKELINSKNLDIKEQASLLDEEVNYEGEFHYINLRTRCL